MSKRPKVFQWFAIGCGGLLILAIISANLLLRSVERGWEDQLATMIATDDSISAFGDDAHAVPITPSSALSPGETGTVFGVEITLDNTGFLKTAENVVGEWEYWFVEFAGKSISNEIQYGINPDVEAQIQYLHGDSYIWSLHEFDQAKCDYGNTRKGINFGESFHCRFVYVVPADERNLYWVYTRTDNGNDGEYEERYVVFQIR